MEELAQEIGNLRYDVLADFLGDLAKNIDEMEVVSNLTHARDLIDYAWEKICQKYDNSMHPTMLMDDDNPISVYGIAGILAHGFSYLWVADFLEDLANDIKKQSNADFERKRPKLAGLLSKTAAELYRASNQLDEILKRC